jgi:hypothetical protein
VEADYWADIVGMTGLACNSAMAYNSVVVACTRFEEADWEEL